MALDAFQQQDELDARFARTFQPIDRIGQNAVAIAQLKLQQDRENQARLSQMFDTIRSEGVRSREAEKERTFRSQESEASRRGYMEQTREQQRLISERNDKLAKIAEDKDAAQRKVNTSTYRAFLKQRNDLEQKIADAYEVPMAVRNGYARRIAESAKASPEVLNQFFNLNSTFDNAANFSKIKGANAEFLQEDYSRLVNGYLIPRVARAKEWQKQVSDLNDLIRPLAAHIDLSQVADDQIRDRQYQDMADEEIPIVEPTDPLQKMQERVAAQRAAAPVQERGPNNVLGFQPIGPMVSRAATELGKDISAVNPLTGVGDFYRNIITGAPIPPEDPAITARRAQVLTAGPSMLNRPAWFQNAPGAAPVSAPALQSVPVTGPFGPPPSDSELPGLHQALQSKGLKPEILANFNLFIQEARSDPSGLQMRAIQKLREEMKAMSLGKPFPSPAMGAVLTPQGGPYLNPATFSPIQPPLQ